MLARRVAFDGAEEFRPRPSSLYTFRCYDVELRRRCTRLARRCRAVYRDEFTEFERIPTSVSVRPAHCSQVCCVYRFHHHPAARFAIGDGATAFGSSASRRAAGGRTSLPAIRGALWRDVEPGVFQERWDRRRRRYSANLLPDRKADRNSCVKRDLAAIEFHCAASDRTVDCTRVHEVVDFL